MNPADMEGMVPAAPTILSILDRRSGPKAQGPPPIYRQSRGEGASEPKSVRPSQQVSEFPKELPHGLS